MVHCANLHVQVAFLNVELLAIDAAFLHDRLQQGALTQHNATMSFYGDIDGAGPLTIELTGPFRQLVTTHEAPFGISSCWRHKSTEHINQPMKHLLLHLLDKHFIRLF